MPYTVKLEQYEGPLDLLLQLIEAEKLDISEISLAKVTDDYLRLLEANPDLPPEELADFLVVASRLLLIKSRLLLPYLQIGEEDEGVQDLESQLRIYKAYLDASLKIEKLFESGQLMFVREKLPPVEIGFLPPKGLNLRQIHELFTAVVKRLEPVIKEEKQVLERVVSIHDKIRQIKDLLSRSKKTNFRSVISSSSSKLEIIVSFLALLELVKQRSVSVVQKNQFDDICITRN